METKYQKESELEIVALKESLKEPVVKLYSAVFAGPPWFEQFKCTYCGQQYGGENENEETIKGKYASCINNKCLEPTKALNIVPFYEGTFFNAEEQKEVRNLGEAIYLDALIQPGFIGVAGKLDDKFVGFSWGFKLPEKKSPSVWFDEVQKKFSNEGINTDKMFYSAETGVDPAYQKNGLGVDLSKARLSEAKKSGYELVTFRTKNGKLLKVYEKLFGENNGIKLFPDPDPTKDPAVRWYVWDFKDLKE